MIERDIACILSSKWAPKVCRHIVRLGFANEKAEEVWMTERQLSQLEAVFARTPKDHSSARLQVVGVWNDRGYYAYAKLEKTAFIPPPQYSLKDLEDE